MADDTQPNLKQKSKELNAVYSNTQTANVLSTADKKDSSSKQYQQLRQALDDNTKTVQQLRQAIADYASKLRQQGKISKEAQVAVHMQMNDEQLQKKISQFGDQQIFMNIKGDQTKIKKLKSVIQQIRKQAKNGEKDAVKLIKSLNSVDIKNTGDAGKALNLINKQCKKLGTSVDQLQKKAKKGVDVFNNWQDSANKASSSTQELSQGLKNLCNKFGLANKIGAQNVAKIAAVGAGALSVGKQLHGLAKSYQGVIEKVIEYNRSTAILAAKGSDLIPGGAKQLDNIRRQMNLTRQQTVQVAESMNQLRGTAYSINDLTSAMQGMKNTIGQVDTTKLKQLTQIMKQIPKQQLDALTGKGGVNAMNAGDDVSALLTMQKNGQLGKFSQLATSGALGQGMAQAYGVKVNQNDKQYIDNKRAAQTMKQTVQNKAHDATSGLTKFLPIVDAAMQMKGQINKIGSVISGVFASTSFMVGQLKKQTKQSKSAKNATQKNTKATQKVKNTIEQTSSATHGKLDSIHSNLCGGGSIHDMVGQILSKMPSSTQEQVGQLQQGQNQNQQSDTKSGQGQNKQKKKKKKQRKNDPEKQKAGRQKAGSKEQIQQKRRQRRQAKRQKKAQAKARGGKQARVAKAQKTSMLKQAKKIKLAKKGTSTQRIGKLLKNPKAVKNHGKAIQRLLAQNIAKKNFAGKGLGMAKNFVSNNIPFGQNLLSVGSKLGGTKIGKAVTSVGSKVIGKANTKIGQLASKVATTEAGRTAMAVGARGTGRMATRAAIAIGGKSAAKNLSKVTGPLSKATGQLAKFGKIAGPIAAAAAGIYQLTDSIHTSVGMGEGKSKLKEKNESIAKQLGINPKLLSNSSSEGTTNAYGEKSFTRSITDLFRSQEDKQVERLSGGSGINYGQIAGDVAMAAGKIIGGVMAIKGGLALAGVGAGATATGVGAAPGVAGVVGGSLMVAGGAASVASGVVDIGNISVVISQMKKNSQEREKFYRGTIRSMKQSDKVVQENNKQLLKISVANAKALQGLDTSFKQISNAATLFDLNVQVQSSKLDKALILGTNNNQFSSSRSNMVENASTSYDKTMTLLQNKKTQIMNNNDISHSAKTAMLAQIMQKQIQLRQKYQKNLLKALSLENIPSVMQNQLQKKFSTAKLDLSNAGWFTDSAGNAAQQADILMKSFQDLMATTDQMSKNQAQKGQFLQENKQRQQSLYQQAFSDSNNATAAVTKDSSQKALQEYIAQSNKDIEAHDQSAWNIVDFGATTDNDSIIFNANQAAKKGKKIKRDDSGTTSDDAAKEAMKQANQRLAKAIASDDTSDQVLRQIEAQRMILKQVTHLKGGSKIGDLRRIANDEDADQEDRQRAQKAVADYDSQMARLDILQKNVMQRRAQKQRFKSVSAYSQDASKFTNGRDLKDHQLLKDQNFKKRAMQAGAIDKQGKITNADAFRNIYQGARKQELSRQLFKSGLNSKVDGTKAIFTKIKQQNKDLFDKDGNLRRDLNDQQRARANRVALQAYQQDEKFGNQMVAQSLGKKDGKKYSQNDKIINDTNTKLQTYSGAIGDDGWKQLMEKNVSASVSQLQLLKKSGKVTSASGKRQLAAAQAAADQLKLIQQAIKKGGQYKGAKGLQLQSMRQMKAKQLQTHINAAGGSVAKRDGNVVAFGSAAKQIQQAARYQATTIMANTQNMQQLGDKFKAFSQSLQNIVAAINNDANVRRKQLQAQIAAQQKQVAQWSGDSKGTNAVGVYQKEMDASQQKLKVASLQRGSLEKIQKAQKSDSFYKTVADQAKTFVSQDSTLKKYGGQDAAKKFAAIFEKMQKKGKNLTDQDRQNNIAQIGKIARQSKDKAMTQFLKNKGVANADKMSAADKQKQLKRITESDGSAKSQWQHIAGGFDNMNAIFSSLAKGQGQVAVALQQIRSVQLQALAAQAASTKKMVQSLMTVRDTITKLGTQVKQKIASNQLQLSAMNMGNADEMIGSTKTMMQQSKVRYDQQKTFSKTAIKDAQSQLKSAQQNYNKVNSDPNATQQQKKKAQQNLKQAQIGVDAAVAHDKGLDVTFFQQQAQRFKRGIEAFNSVIQTSMQSIQIAQQYAESVSGTTQQWFKLQNQKLSLQKKQVDGLRQFTKTQEFANLSSRDKAKIMNQLNKAQLKLAQDRIGAQRNVFEKMLGSILGGLQQQGAFKGFNQASVFGVGHGINEAGMAVSQGGESKGSYSTRTLLANSPTALMGTRGSQTGITNAVNNLGSDAGNTSTKDKPANVANGSSNSSSSNSSTTQPPTQNSGNNANNQNGNANNNQQPTKDEANAKAAAKQQADTQQQKKEKQKQAANAQLKDHQIFAKQLTILQKMLQIMNGGVAVAIDKTTGQPNSNNANADNNVKGKNTTKKSIDIKGGQSVQTGLVGNAEVQIPQTQKDLDNNKLKQQVLQKQIGAIEGKLKDESLSQKDRANLNETLKKKKDQLNKTKEQEKQLTSHLAKFTPKQQQQPQQQPQQQQPQDGTNVKGKQRVTEAQYNASKDNLERRNRDGFFGLFKNGQTKHSKRRIQLIQKKEQLDKKIKGASSIDQKKKLQAQRDQVDKDLKQVTVDQNADRDRVARFQQQKKDDKAQYEKAVKNLQKQGDNPWTFWKDQGQTKFEQVRQSLNMQHNRIQQKIKVAKTPQERAQLQKKKADIQKRNEENNAAQKRAKEVVKQYSQHGNLNNMYRTDNNTQQPNAKNDPKRQGNITVTQQNNNQSGGLGQGSVRRIPFEDMSSDNSRGKINGYIQVQVVRRVVINSGDGNFNKQMSPLQGAGATS